MNILILPGVNSGTYLFEGVDKLFKDDEVLVLNPPGVGKPPMLELKLPFTPKAYAREALKIVENSGWDRFVLIGHSMGGYAAQELAMMVPQKIEKLVLVSTSAGQPATTRDVAAMPAKLKMSFWEMNQMIEKNPVEGMKPMFGSRFISHQRHAYEAFIKARAANLPTHTVSLAHLTAGGTFSSMAWIRRLNVPALVVHGSDDVLVTAASGKQLASLMPDAQYIEMHGVGHFPMLEHPDFWRYVKDFLAGNGAGQKVAPLPVGGFWSKLKEVLTRHG
ncbi:MAG TPA: alpha/beta hydrolase [Alphaproteobacteria bacterium]|nr:alpha/beta hydrolase [Alphaproteobacteria bacterium]